MWNRSHRVAPSPDAATVYTYMRGHLKIGHKDLREEA
jgi:hypothetical protein